MTVVGVLVPMYLLQVGIQHTSTYIVMMTLCLIPVFTLFFQLFDQRLQWSNSTFIAVLALLLFAILSFVVEHKKSTTAILLNERTV